MFFIDMLAASLMQELQTEKEKIFLENSECLFITVAQRAVSMNYMHGRN